MADSNAAPPAAETPPLTPGLRANFRFDFLAGFLVFLIAMPLCLGIAVASQYPPIAGIWTAVIGGILTGLISNSQLTIKGPAAGLIVIVSGAVLELGMEAAPEGTDPRDLATLAKYGYPLALGIGVTAGIVQILFGLVKAGKLGEVVPLTPVHGMLAAIGITIVAKQVFLMLGQAPPPGAPIDSILAVPSAFTALGESGALRTVALVGATALAIMISFPLLKARVKVLKPVPAQVVVVLVAIPMGLALGFTALGASAGNSMKFLVPVRNVLDAPAAALTWPDFHAVATATGMKYVALFALIGSIESMLSSQAIDMIDPWRRKTDQNRDLLAVGVANTLCSVIGALPMISEIVRSKANIDNGARTQYANLYHGAFLLAFVLFLPFVIRMIPLAALTALLVFTGLRLASPREFVHAYRVGPEQLFVFVSTILVTLCTDLLIGVVSGTALKLVVHIFNGMPLRCLFRPDIEVAHNDTDRIAVLKVRQAAVFSNWLGVEGAILKYADTSDEVQLDLSEAKLVDHTVMEKLHLLEDEIAREGKRLVLVGLEDHVPMSAHPLAARRARPVREPAGV